MKLFIGITLMIITVAMGTIIEGPIEYNGHIYYLLDNATWTESEAEAVALGGYLVTVNDQTENDWITDQFSPSYDRNLWIGYTDQEVEGSFNWISGEPSSFENWGAGEPNDWGGQDYAYIVGDYVPLDSPTPRGEWDDCNNDGYLPSNTYYGVVEVNQVAGVEIIYGPVDSPYNNNLYYLLSSGTYYESQTFCESLGGNLATVLNEAENTWLVDTFVPVGPSPKTFWIGFSDVEVEGNWVWESGADSTYTNWNPIEPNGGTGENWACLVGDHIWGTLETYEWNDNGSGCIFYGILEIVPTHFEITTWASIKNSFQR